MSRMLGQVSAGDRISCTW